MATSNHNRPNLIWLPIAATLGLLVTILSFPIGFILDWTSWKYDEVSPEYRRKMARQYALMLLGGVAFCALLVWIASS